MDLEKRREELEQTRAGERSDDGQRTRPWEGGTPRETTAGEPATPTAEPVTGGGDRLNRSRARRPKKPVWRPWNPAR